MRDPRDRWLLEKDAEGEVRTLPATNDRDISEALATPYAALYNSDDESCIWCVGEPDRRVIEVRTCEDRQKPFHGVVSKLAGGGGSRATVRVDDHVVEVLSAEVLSRAEAELIFQEFWHSKSIPPEFRVLEKAYVFGDLTAGRQ